MKIGKFRDVLCHIFCKLINFIVHYYGGSVKLKTDENGQAVLAEGKPVYVYEDGKESAFDAPAAMAKISDLNNEAMKHRLRGKEAKEELEALRATFEGLDPEQARQALETVANLTEEQRNFEEQREKLKTEMQRIYEEREGKLRKSWTDTEKNYKKALQDKENELFTLKVTDQFSNSPFLKDKTILTPDVAARMFGDNFTIEEWNGQKRVVGFLNGERIISRERPGDPAGFEEALSVIFDAYPHKTTYLKTKDGGPDAAGNIQPSHGRIPTAEFNKMTPRQKLQVSMRQKEAAA
jgi:hypothetical protein